MMIIPILDLTLSLLASSYYKLLATTCKLVWFDLLGF